MLNPNTANERGLKYLVVRDHRLDRPKLMGLLRIKTIIRAHDLPAETAGNQSKSSRYHPLPHRWQMSTEGHSHKVYGGWDH